MNLETKLSELKNCPRTEIDNWIISHPSNYPFYSLRISPKGNPYGLFDFSIIENHSSEGYYLALFKTSYFTNPVVEVHLSKDATIDDALDKTNEILIKIKSELKF